MRARAVLVVAFGALSLFTARPAFATIDCNDPDLVDSEYCASFPCNVYCSGGPNGNVCCGVHACSIDSSGCTAS
jgi:hypothetical protein